MLLELFSAVAAFSVRAEGITKKLNVIFFQLLSNNSQLTLLQRQFCHVNHLTLPNYDNILEYKYTLQSGSSRRNF